MFEKLPLLLLGKSIETISEEYRLAFMREVLWIISKRMRLLLFFSNPSFFFLIYVVNIRNSLMLTEAENSLVFKMHVILLLVNALALGLLSYRRAKTAEAIRWNHFTIFSVVYVTLILSAIFFIVTVIKANGHPIFIFLAVLALSTSFLLPPRVLIFTHVVFVGSLWTFMITFALPIDDPRFTSEAMIASLGISMLLVASGIAHFKTTVEAFRQRTTVEKERNIIVGLHLETEAMNQELLSRQEILEQQAAEIEITSTALHEKNLIIEEDRALLARERERSERLLLSVLPAPIAERMKAGETRIAEHFSGVTVLFADIVGFTKLSANVNAQQLVELLDNIFSALDALAREHGLEKIKTIGDAYMVVSGVPLPTDDHSERVARFALALHSTLEAVRKSWVLAGKELGAHPVQMRIGIHTGEAVAGVIGTSKFSYDLWGDTVNTASRMESHGEAGKIHVSEEVYVALQEKFIFEERGEIEVKGKGRMRTWFLVGENID